MRDDEVITAATARAEELFDKLVDTLSKEDDPLGVGCSRLMQLTRFIREVGRAAEGAGSPRAWQSINSQPTRLIDHGAIGRSHLHGGLLRCKRSTTLATYPFEPDFGDS